MELGLSETLPGRSAEKAWDTCCPEQWILSAWGGGGVEGCMCVFRGNRRDAIRGALVNHLSFGKCLTSTVTMGSTLGTTNLKPQTEQGSTAAELSLQPQDTAGGRLRLHCGNTPPESTNPRSEGPQT